MGPKVNRTVLWNDNVFIIVLTIFLYRQFLANYSLLTSECGAKIAREESTAHEL